MNEIIELSDEIVVERVLAGETHLFELVMRRHNQKLYRIARGMGIHDQDCDDLLQQTYFQAYTKLDQFKGNSSFSTWLVRILINQCLMARRSSQSSVTVTGELEGFDEIVVGTGREPITPESEMIKEEVRRMIEQSIEQLPEDYRVVYVMREIEAMSIKDIAAALGLTEVNVKVRLLRARTKLRSALKSYLRPTEIYEFGNARCDAIVSAVLRSVSGHA